MLHFSGLKLLFAMILLLSLTVGAVLSIPRWTIIYAAGTGTGAPEMSWSMLGYNPEHTGFNVQEHKLGAANVGKLQLDWRYSLINPAFSLPIVANGVAFIGTDDLNFNFNLYALDIKTRTLKWSYLTKLDITPRYGNSPAVANGVVYVSPANNLYALDAQTGALKWQYAMDSGFASSPTVINGVVYVSLASDSYCCGGTVYAFDALTGKIMWKYITSSVVDDAPTVANGVVYVNSYGSMQGASVDGYLFALDAQTGSLKWSYDIGKGVTAYPAVTNGVVYVNAADNNAYALNAQTGVVEWKYPIVSSSSPAVANGVVYIGSVDGHTYALDAQTGVRKWSSLGNGYGNSPAVANGVVYIGSDKHKIYALNARTGARLWSFVKGGASWTSPVVVNGMLYMIAFSSTSPASSILYVFHVWGAGYQAI